MAELIKVGFLGIAGVLLAIQFRADKPEYATYIGLAISIIIFCFSMRQVEIVTEQFAKIKSYLNGAEGYLAILLKVIGITYICEFSSDICRDAGYQAVAGQIEVLVPHKFPADAGTGGKAGRLRIRPNYVLPHGFYALYHGYRHKIFPAMGTEYRRSRRAKGKRKTDV